MSMQSAPTRVTPPPPTLARWIGHALAHLGAGADLAARRLAAVLEVLRRHADGGEGP